MEGFGVFKWKGFRVVMAHLQWKISEEEEDGEIGAGSTDLRRMLQKYTEGRSAGCYKNTLREGGDARAGHAGASLCMRRCGR